MSFLVNVYAKCGVMVNARKVFDNLPRSNVVVWITLITGYVQNSQPKVAVAVLGDVFFSFKFYSINCFECLFFFEVYCIGETVPCLHSLNTGSVMTPVLEMLFVVCTQNLASLESSVKAFRETGEKDVISWTMILCACGDNGRAGIKTFH
jgi:hypothetical protein